MLLTRFIWIFTFCLFLLAWITFWCLVLNRKQVLFIAHWLRKKIGQPRDYVFLIEFGATRWLPFFTNMLREDICLRLWIRYQNVLEATVLYCKRKGERTSMQYLKFLCRKFYIGNWLIIMIRHICLCSRFKPFHLHLNYALCNNWI